MKDITKKVFIAILYFLVFIIIVGVIVEKNSDVGAGVLGIFILLSPIIFIIWFYRLRKKTKVAKERQEKLKKQEMLDKVLEEIKNTDLKPVNNAKAILKNGEEAYSAVPATLYELVSKGTNFKGANVRVRVAKGVSIGLGGGKATPDKHFSAVATGQFIITNQRVVFAGDKKSFEIKFGNLTYFDKGYDYITFHAGTRNHTIGMDNMIVQISEAILNKLLK